VLENRTKLFYTEWVRPGTLRKFVKNLGVPCGVIVLVKGMAINGERCLAWHAEISHKFTFNYGF